MEDLSLPRKKVQIVDASWNALKMQTKRRGCWMLSTGLQIVISRMCT